MADAPMTNARILIVDDEPMNVRLLERLLVASGYEEIATTTDSREALARYRAHQPDLVLLDLMMPHLDGIAVLEQLKAEIRAGDYVPVLVLTADATLDAKRRALAAGARDFVTKPFEQTEVVLRIANLLETRRLHRAVEDQNRSLEQTVSERTRQLLQTEKIATMGSLLAGVAHELNNPLAVVSGNAELLRARVTDPDLVRRADRIKDATDRCVRIVRNFLALARQRPPERSVVSLAGVVRGAVELLGYQLRTDDVQVTIDLPERLPTLWADEHQLHQVLVNLIGNAHHAMRRQSGPRAITIRARHDAERGQIRIEVGDTGPGIAPDVRAKIFEPFFTTKPVGEGTGLGLSLCRGIVEEHRGTIAVESEPGRGTTFVIDLPVLAPPHAAMAVEDDTLPPLRPGNVLVIDDEAEIGAVVAEALGHDGHRADVATNGRMGLEMLAKHPYDAIVCDTKMAVLDGESFFEELGRRFPTLQRRVIFHTGDMLSREKRAFLERTGRPVLAKPCDLGELRRLVRRVLA